MGKLLFLVTPDLGIMLDNQKYLWYSGTRDLLSMEAVVKEPQMDRT